MKNSGLIMSLVVALILLLFALPTAVVLAVGLIPTFFAVVVDSRTGRSEGLAVLALNFAGVLPFVAKLWHDGHTVERALKIISDPYAWLVIFGASAMAFGLLKAMPAVIQRALDAIAERRVRKLKERQAELLKEWGSEIIKDATG